MVVITPLSSHVPISVYSPGLGYLAYPALNERWDGKSPSWFPENASVAVSKVLTHWEFGTTTTYGAYTVTNQKLEPGTIPDVLVIKGSVDGMRVVDMSDSFLDTVQQAYLIAREMGIRVEEGFYRALFQFDDVFKGGKGNDRIQSYDGADQINGGAGRDSIRAGNGDDTVSGGKGHDSIYGDDGNDALDGDAGRDFIAGDKGRDTLKGGSGNDSLEGGTGRDRLFGGSGHDYLYGNAGNDRLNGQFGDDTLRGGRGADFLEGGRGDDILFGGAGVDRFVFHAIGDRVDLGTDTIRDFQVGTDKIDFRQSDVSEDVLIQAYADGTEIVVSTPGISAIIRLQGIDLADLRVDDFLFPVL